MCKGWSTKEIYLCKEVVTNVLKQQRASVDRSNEQEYELNPLRTRFAEEEGLQLEQGNGGATSTGVHAGSWLEDAATDKLMEQLNGAAAVLGVLVLMCMLGGLECEIVITTWEGKKLCLANNKAKLLTW